MDDDRGFGIFQENYGDDPEGRATKIKELVGPLMDHIAQMIEEKVLNTIEEQHDGLVAWMEDEVNREEVAKLCGDLVKEYNPAVLYCAINVVMNFLVLNFAAEMREKEAHSVGDDFWDAVLDNSGQGDTFLNNIKEERGGEVERDNLTRDDDDDLDSFLRGNG